MDDLITRLRNNYENWSMGSKGPGYLLEAADALATRDARIADLEAEVERLKSATPVSKSYDATMDKIDYVMDSRGETHTSFMLVFSDDKAVDRLYRRPSEARLSRDAGASEEIAKLLWERFAPGGEVEWPSTHAAEYRLAAEDISNLVERKMSSKIRDLIERHGYEFDQLDAICKGLQGERATLETAIKAAEARATAAEERLKEAVRVIAPFSDMAGEMFARNWNASDLVIALDNPDDPHRLRVGDFFEIRAAKFMEGKSDTPALKEREEGK